MSVWLAIGLIVAGLVVVAIAILITDIARGDVGGRHGVAVQASPEEREVGHSSTVYGITGDARRKTTYQQNFSPTAVARDIPLLASG